MSMEIPISTGLSTIRCSVSSFCQVPANPTLELQQNMQKTSKKKCPSIATLQCNGSRRRLRRRELRIRAKNSSLEECSDKIGTIWEESGVVEVIGIGSRVDSVLDYCLSASSSSHSLRFWNIIIKDSESGKLQQRLLGRGYGDDHTTAIDILRRIRSANGLVVAIILRPFDFEGRRRQDEARLFYANYSQLEVTALVQKLQECTNFCIEIDINSLLKMDLVTLDEALKTTNRAVYLSISSVAVLTSDMNRKHINNLNNQMQELDVPGIIKVLDSYKEGAVGFGVGNNFETSILQATSHCPFLPFRIKDLDGLVICIISSGNVNDCNSVPTILGAFRQLTECQQDVMISVVYDPDLQPNVITTTVLSMSSTKQKFLKKSSLLSKLVENIPMFFNFLRNPLPEADSSQPSIQEKESSSLPTLTNPPNNKVLDEACAATPVQGFEMHSIELQTSRSESFNEKHLFRENGSMARNETNEVQYSDFDADTSSFYEETISYQREPLLSRDFGLASKSGDELTKDRTMNGASIGFDKPIGVRQSSNADYSNDVSTGRLDSQSKTKNHTTSEALALLNGSGITDVPSTSNGKYSDGYKKQGILSARAASMLEAERDSEKKWNRLLEIGYKGGTYKGHCQGGLPEGRGRLQFPDGSAFDGMWRYGKRSGVGTFYFSNGDVFQGTWRDDLMHGKGWLYFHNGDRWFSNFWKGLANGEGRFYSKSGEVFYGHFRDGWRDGSFQCVKHDGTRFVEIWEDGVLLHREQLDFGTDFAASDDKYSTE
ncbi:hypothetical protein V2J09_024123 [Rumex salicifolius]